MSDDVLSFKLDTGEEIIARIKQYVEANNTIVVNRPRAVAVMPGPNGQMGMTLVPFLLSNQEGDVTLERAHIVAATDPTKQLADGYLSSTSGIQIVTK